MPFIANLVRKLKITPIVLVVHRGSGATSTSEPLALELERIWWEEQETKISVPVVRLDETETQPLVDKDATVKRQAVKIPITSDDASFLLDRPILEQKAAIPPIDLQAYRKPEPARIAPETITLHNLHGIVTYRDAQNELDLNALCLKAVQRFQKKSGVLPTHVIVNSMRLLSERAPDEWETFLLPTMFGAMPVALRGMKNCPYNTARCVMEQGVRVA